jgi:hypothetical protein
MLYPASNNKAATWNTPAFPAIFGLAGTGTSDALQTSRSALMESATPLSP